jgi:branched-chain amino acid transport system permease protein
MRHANFSNFLLEIARPIGQIIIFILGSGLSLSIIILLLAILIRGSAPDKAVISSYGYDIFQYTLINLPQVLIDGVTIGFVYAAIALGYTMVYGVLEFINFAHSEIFAIGDFIGVELLIVFENAGILKDINIFYAYLALIAAIIAGMIASGLTAVLVEVTAYRPLRNAPRLVPLISAIGVSFFLQDAIRLTESLTSGQFHRIIPTFGNFDERVSLAKIFFGSSITEISIQVKSIIVIIAAIIMLVGLNYLVNATKVGKAIRSVAQDRQTANLMGIPVNNIISITFLIGGALGGAAGVCMH